MLDSSARAAARAKAQARIDAATSALTTGTLTQDAWSEEVSDALATAYLLDTDPRWQSGFDGDAALWREARELILQPVTRDGTFLDVGCANGHLVECLTGWAKERRQRLTFYGLELSPKLIATARQRLPELASHLFQGSVVTWRPPRQFTYVHTGLEYVPPDGRPELVRRLLHAFLEPGGVLITGPIADTDLEAQQGVFHAAGIREPRLSDHRDRHGKRRSVVWCTRPGAE